MDFINGKELLSLCEKYSLPISQIMLKREATWGKATKKKYIPAFQPLFRS